jgi:predicted phosphodiesterase
MKVALLSDIHGNLTALQAVLNEISKHKPDLTVCLGDIVGYGPWPERCIRLIGNSCQICVLGNHDKAILEPKTVLPEMSKFAKKGIGYTMSRFKQAGLERKFLASLPLTAEILDGRVCLAHGSYVKKDVWIYVDEEDVANSELASLPETAQLVCVGHTHSPLVYGSVYGLRDALDDRMLLNTGEEKFIINPGSVGQPRDGDCRASYGVLEFHGKEVRFTLERVFYDIDRTARKLAETGLPDWLSERLYRGE